VYDNSAIESDMIMLVVQRERREYVRWDRGSLRGACPGTRVPS